ncbi:MAG TPA: type 4a pilus biogenesis protein PilO [Syntrophorhabdaceae bacterium]|mgnify:CR=1 FL=1|nr:type 4a pilus biogenesis protein PilO [Syntrophorhabdaceae bacterium]HPP42356.1 type 4a pilus biogenesis protein PilO [Syntrophorhabdaceae bacterium]HQE80314.1 type 4a pilus biogenesis protein PilO [Syntrophorhabdaceae bacterium]HQH43216.1 type 4a pilus biogenesis protein PilO [Syntrophorhabdaceae bacterium]HQK46346.1 type 4a pilus biogenesis protein PilO [Syntrophorhabdaceae bacterium]
MKKPEINLKAIEKKIIKIPKVYKLIFSLVFNIGIFALCFFLILSPQLEEKDKLNKEYQELKKELDRMVFIKNNMNKYRQEFERISALYQESLKQLPEHKDIPNLLRNVTNLGTETRLKITYFEPKPVQSKEFYAELPFVIKYNAPFHNVAYFFDGIRRLERIMTITSFKMAPDPKSTPGRLTLSGECVAKTYVYMKEQPKKDAKKPPAPPKK